jgi:hypothetical protein
VAQWHKKPANPHKYWAQGCATFEKKVAHCARKVAQNALFLKFFKIFDPQKS